MSAVAERSLPWLREVCCRQAVQLVRPSERTEEGNLQRLIKEMAKELLEKWLPELELVVRLMLESPQIR